MNLSEAIHSVPASMFKHDRSTGKRTPDYSGIFVSAISSLLESRGVKFQPATLEAVASNVNLSSFQRSVALEAARRYGQADESGQRDPSTIKEPVKKIPVKAAPRGADPITGEKSKKKSTKKPAKPAPAPKKTAAKLPAVKPAAKVEKKAPVKKTAPAKKPATAPKKVAPAPSFAPAVDPITGEVVP